MTLNSSNNNSAPSGFEAAVMSLAQTLSNQAKPLLGVVILAVVGVGLWQGQRAYENHRELSAQEKIGPLLLKLDQKIQDKMEFENAAKTESPDSSLKKDLKAVTLEGDLMPLAAEIKESLSALMARQVAQFAAIQLADFYLENKKPQEAQEVLDLALKASSKNSWAHKMLQIQLSTTLIELNQFEQALTVLEGVDLSQPNEEPLKASMELRKALLREKLGQVEVAQSDLLKISIDEEGKESVKRASQLLRLQKLKMNLKGQGGNEAPR